MSKNFCQQAYSTFNGLVYWTACCRLDQSQRPPNVRSLMVEDLPVWEADESTIPQIQKEDRCALLQE